MSLHSPALALATDQAPAAGPGDDPRVAGGFGAETIGAGRLADSGEVEPVGIPAGSYRDPGDCLAAGVAGAGLDQQVQPLGVQVEDGPGKSPGQRGAARAVLRVAAVIVAAGVVEVGEEFDDIGPRAGEPASRRPFARTRSQCPRPWIPSQSRRYWARIISINDCLTTGSMRGFYLISTTVMRKRQGQDSEDCDVVAIVIN